MSTNRLNTLLQMDSGDTSIVSLPINKLDFLQDSPFKIYQGEKKEQLIQSIKDNGIIIPIIVTPIENSRGRYTILSGANRVDAATKLNFEEVKAVKDSEDVETIKAKTEKLNKAMMKIGEEIYKQQAAAATQQPQENTTTKDDPNVVDV